MRPQPLISVTDVPLSSRWYQELLGCESGPIGDEYERLVRGGMLVLRLHRFDVEHHHGRIAARILALTAAIHLNWQLGLPPRALTAYGH